MNSSIHARRNAVFAFLASSVFMGPKGWAAIEPCTTTRDGQACSYVNTGETGTSPTIKGLMETDCRPEEGKSSCEQRACAGAEQEAVRRASLQCDTQDALRMTKNIGFKGGLLPKLGRSNRFIGQCTAEISFSCSR